MLFRSLLVNGERPPAGFSLENLAPDLIEKIEVLRAATAEFSTQAIAGTINIVLRKTVAKASRELRASGGGAGSMAPGTINLSASGKGDSSSYTLGGSVSAGTRKPHEHGRTERHDSAGVLVAARDDAGGSRNALRSMALNSRLNWTPAPGSTLGWQVFFNAFQFKVDRNTLTTVQAGEPYPYAVFGYQRRERFANLRSDLAWSHKAEDGSRFDSSIGIDAADSLRKRWSQASNAAGAPTLDRYYLSAPDSQRASWTGKYAWPAVGGHTFSAGWDASYSQMRDNEVQDEAAFPGVDASDFKRAFNARLRKLAGFVQDEWEISPQLSLYMGLRHEASHTSSTISTGPDFAPQSVSAGVSSPILQGLWKLPGDARRQVRVAVARTFRAPDVNQLQPRRLRSYANSEVEPDSGGNPALRPEIARGLDLAYEHYWSDGALWSLSAGTRHIDDVTFNSIAFEDGRWISAPRNQGSARTRSVELETKFPLGGMKLALNLGRHWSHVAAVAGPGNRLARQSPWTGNASIDYRRNAWSSGASASFSTAGWSRVTLQQYSYGGVQRTLEAYASYRPDANSQLRLSAMNLLRPAALSGSRYEDGDGTLQTTERIPGRASVRLGYERKF